MLNALHARVVVKVVAISDQPTFHLYRRSQFSGIDTLTPIVIRHLHCGYRLHLSYHPGPISSKIAHGCLVIASDPAEGVEQILPIHVLVFNLVLDGLQLLKLSLLFAKD